MNRLHVGSASDRLRAGGSLRADKLLTNLANLYRMPGFVSTDEREVVIERPLTQCATGEEPPPEREAIAGHQCFTDVSARLLQCRPGDVRGLARRLRG